MVVEIIKGALAGIVMATIVILSAVSRCVTEDIDKMLKNIKTRVIKEVGK